MLNNVFSDADKGARFMALDPKDRFSASSMNDPKYMKTSQCYIPTDII